MSHAWSVLSYIWSVCPEHGPFCPDRGPFCPWSVMSLIQHEELPSSHKMCLQIEAVISICLGEDLMRSIRSCPT